MAPANPKATPAMRKAVRDANVELARRGLAPFTFGNASAIDRERGLVVIKPSGVPYDKLRPQSMVVTDLHGKVLEGKLRPSSDQPTHLVLYHAFESAGGIVHTHSHYATAWAQAGREIPCLGTTHADYFHGSVPVTQPLTDAEVRTEYEANTGHAIVQRFKSIDPMQVPAVLLSGHASFAWGRSVEDAVENMSVLEEVARLAYDTIQLNAGVLPVSAALRDKHFNRKHGEGAYYGQG
jgi:L-ribulose-5-phosphate 4-epimerase